ncbi:MAG: transglycosylase SLT domain-containing protein [Candidatus Margulisiibacteriota bacterium]
MKKSIGVCLLLFFFLRVLWGSDLSDFQRAKYLYRKQEYNQALLYFEKLSKYNNPVQNFALYYAAVCNEQLKQYKTATPVYEKLINEYPRFPLAWSIKRKISDYYFNQRQWSYFTEKSLWAKAKELYSRGDRDKAQEAFHEYKVQYPSTENYIEADYYLGINALHAQKNSMANWCFDRYIKGKGKNIDWARYYKVVLLDKQDKYNLAENGYRWLAGQYTGSGVGICAMEKLALLFHRQDKYQDAITAYKEFVNKYPQHYKARNAYFQMGRIRYLEENNSAANYCFRKAAGYKASGNDTAETLYMQYKTENKQNQDNGNLLIEIAEKYFYTYYGWLARNKLKLQYSDANEQKTINSQSSMWQRLIPGVKTFLKINDYEDAAIVVKDYKENNPTANLSLPLFLIELYEKAEDYYSAQRFGESVWVSYEKLGKLKALPLELWQKGYPQCYETIIRKTAVENGLDPLLVMALIREESRFNKDSGSYAGAVGLMQLMPSTAAAEAKKNDMPVDGDLKDPTCNIKLGVMHLAYLIKAYKGNISYAMAAYNGGINVANRWIHESKELPEEEFTERIGYVQSRYYVKKVLKSYWTYQWLYNEGIANIK